VSKDVTIRGRGAGASTLTSTGAVFTVSAATSLTLEGLSIESKPGASTTQPRGGILNSAFADSMVTIRDSTLSGGRATYGGAIFSTGTLVVSDSTFADNTARIRSQGEVPVGGAIYGAYGGVELERVDFVGNDALSESGFGSYGGAVYLIANPLVEWVDVSFTDNTATVGGAGWISGGNVTVVRGEFLRNTGTAVVLDGSGPTAFESTDFGVGDADNPAGDLSYMGAVMFYGNNVDLVCVDGFCQ
jgi:hypothetical protein